MSHQSTSICLHCGTPVPALAMDSRFCCAGCAYVYELLHTQGLDQFYDLRGSQSLPPVPAQAMRERDYEWLARLGKEAESRAGSDEAATLSLAVQGLSCMGCVWLMEKLFQSLPGAIRLDVHVPRGELHLEWQPGVFPLVEFAHQLQQFGYLVGRADEAQANNVQSSAFNRRVGLCGAFALNAMAFCLPSYLGMKSDFMFAAWFDIIAACSATLALLVGGTYFAERSWQALRHGVLHIDTPITLGILAAWLGSMVGWLGDIPSLKYFDFVAIFIFLMLAGRWMQQSAVERNRRRLLQSTAVPADIECCGEDGGVKRMPLSAIAPGQRLFIRSGEVCPVSAVLQGDSASLSLEWINGESKAAPRSVGQAVPSGALNIGTRTIEVEAREAWSASLLNRLSNSRESGADAAVLFANLLRGYLAMVVLLGIAGALVWGFNGGGIAKALQVMISVFVVSCPCALGVAAPFADELAASWMERLGVFVRSHSIWQRLVRIHKVVFDKTGTLTLENPVLRDPDALLTLDHEARCALHHLVSSNLHPVSRSLFDALGPVKHRHPDADEVEEIIGQGLKFVDHLGQVWALGRPGWIHQKIHMQGDAVFTKNDVALAAFEFTDALRPETCAAFETLRREHYELHLLSGDRREKVAGIARTLEIPQDCWQSEMTPEEKAVRVRALNREDTLYIGDGANDSLALEAALCSGSPVTGRNFLEHKADFYFLGNSLRFTATLLEVARLRQSAVRRVFAFALTYNLGAVALSLTGHMSPLLAAILMPLSSIVTMGMVKWTFQRHLTRVRAPQNEHESTQALHGQTGAIPL
ncbi:copper-translocating P-type ATPase [soil metagenome]